MQRKELVENTSSFLLRSFWKEALIYISNNNKRKVYVKNSLWKLELSEFNDHAVGDWRLAVTSTTWSTTLNETEFVENSELAEIND